MEHSPQIISKPVNKNLLGTLATALILSAASGCTKTEERNIDAEPSKEAKSGTVWLENMPTSKLSEAEIVDIKKKKKDVLEKLLKIFPSLDIQVDVKTFELNDFAANPNGKTEYETVTTLIYMEGKEIGVIDGNPLKALDNITEERIRFEVDARSKIKGGKDFKEQIENTSVRISPYAGIIMKKLEMKYKDAVITLNNGKVVPLKSFLSNTKSVEIYGSPFQNFIITCLEDVGIKKDVKFFSKDGEITVPRGDIVAQLDEYCK